jgi:lysophospholipase L1-like esterase
MASFQRIQKCFNLQQKLSVMHAHVSSRHVLLIAGVMCITMLSVGNLFAASTSDSTKKWVGTWSCAPYGVGSGNTPPAITSNTLRQIVRVSIGGDSLRVRFSNKASATSVTMNSVNIAVQSKDSTIDTTTRKQLKFNGSASVTMSAGGTVTSDPIAFTVTPNMHLAITTYYGQAANSTDITGHVGSRTNSYLLSGDQTAKATFAGSTIVTHWYHINTIDVWTSSAAAAVVAYGNSITDGYGLSGGLQNRWPDMFSQALLKNTATAQVSVLNLGIGGTNVSGTGATTGLTRFNADVLGQAGVKWLIVFYGINDICASNASATTVINAYKSIIDSAHAHSIKVYGATITPVNGNGYYTAAHEAVRAAVNKWIRTPGNCDTLIDFDKTIRNPSDTTKLQAAYSNDWLHPNAAGYKLLGESINLNLFTTATSKIQDAEVRKTYAAGKVYSRHVNNTTVITFEIPCDAFVSLKVYSTLGKEIAELGGRNFSAGKHTVVVKGKNLTKGMYVYSFKAGNFSVASGKMMF